MTYSETARTTTRPVRIRRARVIRLLVVIAAIATALGYQSLASSSPTAPLTSPSTAAAPIRVLRGQRPGTPGPADGIVPRGAAVGRQRRALGEAGGAVPAGTTVFDVEVPGVANLDHALLGALRRAATDAGGEGVDLTVNSGWRSAAYEEKLRREAIAKYGSGAEAARWVATPNTSAHVKGKAVDIGPANAAAWLSEHGAAYGLCQIYGN